MIAVTQTNLLFIVNEEYDKLEIWDNELSVLRPVDRLGDGKYFQTYDKKLFLQDIILIYGPGSLLKTEITGSISAISKTAWHKLFCAMFRFNCIDKFFYIF